MIALIMEYSFIINLIGDISVDIFPTNWVELKKA